MMWKDISHIKLFNTGVINPAGANNEYIKNPGISDIYVFTYNDYTFEVCVPFISDLETVDDLLGYGISLTSYDYSECWECTSERFFTELNSQYTKQLMNSL